MSSRKDSTELDGIRGDPADGTYETIVSAIATLKELPPGSALASGAMQIIQGAVTGNPADGYYAFLAVGTLQVPLVASYTTRKVEKLCYEIVIPSSTFRLSLDLRTEPDIVAGVEKVLQWFTTWEGSSRPSGQDTSSAPQKEQLQMHASVPSNQPAQSFDSLHAEYIAVQASSGAGAGAGAGAGGIPAQTDFNGKIEKAGIKTAEVVTSLGQRLNQSLNQRVEASIAANQGRDPRNLKLGGAPTAKALTGAKKVLGTGAGAAATVVDTLSSKIGGVLANNKAMENLRKAPEGTSKKKLHDALVAGGMAVGHVYVAVDTQGKLVLESAGNGAGRVAGVKYGAEAEHAARSMGHIALDGYRIFRFPQKLGATSLLKGAVKGAVASRREDMQSPEGGLYSVEMPKKDI